MEEDGWVDIGNSGLTGFSVPIESESQPSRSRVKPPIHSPNKTKMKLLTEGKDLEGGRGRGGKEGD